MQSQNASIARGHVVDISGSTLVFKPLGTSYHLHLQCQSPPAWSAGQRIEVTMRARARKIWTVPSGGNFVEPIMGPPRTVQGRVCSLDERQMVVQAGTPIVVDLPAEDSAYGLANGDLAVGVLVNVTLMPGTLCEAAATAAVG